MSNETDPMQPANDAAPPPETPQSPDELMQAATSRIAELEAEVQEMKDRWMRAEAETANVRARSHREVNETRQYAVQKFAQDIVEAADNLRRGLESLPPRRKASRTSSLSCARALRGSNATSSPSSSATASSARTRPAPRSTPTCTRPWPSRRAPRTLQAVSCTPGPRPGP